MREIIDYRYIQSKRKSTIKAIRNHKVLKNFLVQSGTADLSVEVDLQSFQNFIYSHYKTHKVQLMTQKDFLILHHIDQIATQAKIYRDNSQINKELNIILVDMNKTFKILEILT